MRKQGRELIAKSVDKFIHFLLHEALRATGSSSGSHACGVGSSGILETGCETAHVEAGTNLHLGLS
jgi:hypothetical protein